MEPKIKTRQYVKELNNQEPTPYVFKDTKHVIRLEWQDRANTQYKVIKDDVINIGKVKTYKDYISQGLNPVLENPNPIYGVAKKMEPKTKTIQDMRASIDDATNKYYELAKQQILEQQEQSQQVVETKGEPSND